MWVIRRLEKGGGAESVRTLPLPPVVYGDTWAPPQATIDTLASKNPTVKGIERLPIWPHKDRLSTV